jgi:hypothetical protein
MSVRNLLASEFDFLKNGVFSEGLANGSWDVKLGEVWSEDFQIYHGRSGRSLAHYRRLTFTVKVSANSIRCFGLVLRFSHRYVPMQQNRI